MTIQEILKQIESKIPKTEQEYFLIHEARYRYILSHLLSLQQAARSKSSQKIRVLDVGCFPYHLGRAMELLGMDVYGISSAHEPLKGKNVKQCNIETDKFPYKDNLFDIVVCTEVLEHLPQSPIRALREMQRVTTPGGKLLITTPNSARSINRLKMLLGKNVSYPLSQLLENEGSGSNLYHRHNREYTMDELATLVTKAGFFVEKTHYFISYTPFRRRLKPDPAWKKFGKITNYVLMNILSRWRDTLLVLGRK